MLLFLLLIGRTLDHAVRRRTRGFSANLAALRVDPVTGEVATVSARALSPGEIVPVRPGDRVPVDGAVIDGRSEIDESLVTGETALQPVAASRKIYAGSFNLGGLLRLKTSAAASRTSLAEIERLIEGAVAGKSRYLRFADRVSRLYAPLVHLRLPQPPSAGFWRAPRCMRR